MSREDWPETTGSAETYRKHGPPPPNGSAFLVYRTPEEFALGCRQALGDIARMWVRHQSPRMRARARQERVDALAAQLWRVVESQT